MNPYEQYYIKQAGSGIPGFVGTRYQKGNGFFGRLITGAVLPLLRVLGKNALKAGASAVEEIADSDNFSVENIKNIGKNALKSGAKASVKDLARTVRSLVQKGNGIRKHKRKTRRRNINKGKPKRKYKRRIRKRKPQTKKKKAKLIPSYLR